ncbi:25-hydroxycholesterol 7-alpha-hydroxylase [Diplogelasinospora grovesii]|uniref:25-hydroxycholesterol 7-alpha-hydroxylase n=1 Tax=Diplogelasinospora grovesii TaxID=303347 RepID=A0AAN6NFQ7_9PEZI|nr:25-hydroxycholesterol 7-alpha-hydroxylase [Diplogelasinospora grovesii]
MPSVIAVAFVALGSIYSFLWILLHFTQNGEEPPVVGSAIPFLGPLVGMIRQKSRFYIGLRDKYSLPIYTLRLPFTRVYVINATELIPAMQKHWRTLSFAALTAKAGVVVGMSKQSTDIMHKDLTRDDSFSLSWVPLITPTMAPGRALDSMNRKSVEVLAADIEKLRSQAQAGTTTVGLWEWTRKAVLMATTDAVYGPQNPYRDAAVEAAWRTFEPGFLTLNLSPLPDYFAPSILRARELLAAAMTEYMYKGGWKSASELVKARHDHHVNRFGFSLEDIARGEIGNMFAVVGNTVPCAWWLLYHVFSDPKVLADVRSEVSTMVQESSDDGICSIDLASIRTACPILLSTYEEMLRYRAVSASVRMVLEDVMLDGRFLLKKGGMVILPTTVQHTAVPEWGENVGEFDHMRFVRTPGKKRPSRLAFRAFGGGHVLCPGRHFASTEIMAVAALMVLQFDVAPVGGKWVDPKWDNSPVMAGFPVPDEDIRVEIRPRDGKKWRVTYSESGKGIEIVEEDMAAAEES